MRISQKTNTKKKLILVLSGVAALFLLAGVLLYWYYSSRPSATNGDVTRPVNTVSYDPPTEEELAEASQQKQDIVEQQGQKPGSQTPPPDSQVIVSVTYAGQANPGAAVNISAFVDGLTSGNCEITLTKSGQPTVTAQAPIQFEATTARCVTDIAVSQFSQSGDWNLSVIAKKDSTASATVTQTVTVTK